MNLRHLACLLLLAATSSTAAPPSRLPMMFEQNAGQFPDGIDFIARGPGWLMGLKPGELLMSLKPGGKTESKLVRCRLVGAQAGAIATGEEMTPCRMSYFLGNDPAHWRTEVTTFGKVRYAGVYPGVDLVYYGNQREIEYDFIVAPGADPGQVAVEFDDAVGLDTATGELVVETADGELRHRAPVAWQMRGAQREPVDVRYVLTDERTAGFSLGSFDPSRSLIVDPVISYSTYLGSSDSEEGNASVVDGAGNTYVTGQTDGAGKFGGGNLGRFYTGGLYDAFILKLNADGTTILQGTLIGGSGTDTGRAIAVDADGNVYIAGDTNSVEGHATPPGLANTLPNPAQPNRHGYDVTSHGGYDGFMLRVNSNFTSVTYSTFLGGPSDDGATGIALAPDGHVWVCGDTGGDWNFPGAAATAGDTTYNGGSSDGYLIKLDPSVTQNGTGLDFFTYLGGDSYDEATGVATDNAGNAYVTGYTFSPNFPLASPFQNRLNGLPPGSPNDWSDAFITKFTEAGAMIRSSFLGGSRNDLGHRVTVDANGRVYLLGTTGSANFPVLNAAQSVHGTQPFLNELAPDIFVTRLNPDATAKEYSTLLGGDDFEAASAIVVDSQFNAYIAGKSASANFPLNHAWDSTLGGALDGVFVKLSPDGDRFMVSTYIGGGGVDGLTGVGLNSQGFIHLCGFTVSSDLAVTPGAFQSGLAGTAADLFFQRIGIDTRPPAVTMTSPLGVTPRALLTPFTGTVEDNDLNGVAVRVQVVELNPAVRYWTGSAWQNAAADGSGPWLAATRSGLGWSVPVASMPGRAQTSPGTYTLRVQAEDADGNLSAPDQVNVVRSGVDTTPPVISFLNPAAEGAVITGSSPELTFSVDDPETGVALGFALVALRKSENGLNTYWNGTAWQNSLEVLVANESGGTYSFPNPPSGAKRPNAQYRLTVSASNQESPRLTASASIAFSVDYYPTYTWSGLAGNNSWIDPGNWSSGDEPGSAPGANAIVVINGASPTIAGNNNVYLRELRISGGSLTVFGTLAVSKKLEMSGGSLNGPVTLYGTSDSTWTAGVITGTLHIVEGGKLTVSGGYDNKFLGSGGGVGLPSNSGTIENFGTIECVVSAGNSAISRIRGYGGIGAGPATITNHSTGVFRMAGDGYALDNYHGDPAALIFNNEGRIVKTAGTGTTSLDVGSLWTFNLRAGSVLENAITGSVLLRENPNAITNIADGAIFRGPGRLAFTAGTPLNAATGSWIVDGAASLELAGCTLACPQAGELLMDVRDDASLHWISGTIHGNLRIPAGVTFHIEGGYDDKFLGAGGLQGTLNNAGIVRCVGSNANQTVARIRGFGGNGPATVNNLPHARLHIDGDGWPLDHYHGGGQTFNNEGRIIKTAGPGTTILDPSWVLNNEPGAFIENAVSGSFIDRPGGTANLKAGSTFYGPGTIRLSAGQCNATAGAWQCVGGVTLLLDGSILACPNTGTLSLEPSADALLRWRSGVIYGNLAIPASATLTVEGGYADKFLGSGSGLGMPSNSGAIENFGTIECVVSAGNSAISRIRGYGGTGLGPATITNHGVFRIAGDGFPLDFYHGDPAALIFNNEGRIVKTAGTGTTSLDVGSLWTFNLRTGSILENAISGSILLRENPNAITNIADGAILRGPGRFVFTAGTPLNAPVGEWLVENGASLELAGCTLACPQTGSFTLQPSADASLHWRSGAIHGNLILPATAKLWVEGGYDDKFLGSGGAIGLPPKFGTIDNFGIIECVGANNNQTVSRIRGYGGADVGRATINNRAGAVMRIAGDGPPLMNYHSDGLTFNNEGTIQKTAGNVISDLSHSWVFNNSGTLRAEMGSIDFASTVNLNPGSRLEGTATGSCRFTAGTVTLRGATAIAGAPVMFTGGTLAGHADGTGSLEGGTLNWTGGTITGTLRNGATGSMVASGDAIKDLETGAVLSNAGSFTWQDAGPLRGIGNSRFRNLAGAAFHARSSSSLSNYNTGNTFENSGALHIGTSPGVLNCAWNFTQTATGVLNIEIGGPADTQFDRLAIDGTVTLGGTIIATRLNGYAPAVTTTFPFLNAAGVTGTFTLVTGGFTPDYTATSATLRVSVAALNFGDWAASKGLTGANALPAANPDKDSSDNFFEYVHNMNPAVPDAPPLTSGTVTVGQQQFLTLGYRTWADREANGISYTLQAGSLTDWSTAGVTLEVDSAAPVIPGSTAFKARVLIRPGDAKFLRMKAAGQ